MKNYKKASLSMIKFDTEDITMTSGTSPTAMNKLALADGALSKSVSFEQTGDVIQDSAFNVLYN